MSKSSALTEQLSEGTRTPGVKNRTTILVVFLVGIALSVVLLFPRLQRHSRFPFTGKWNYVPINGSDRYGGNIVFKEDGSCTISYLDKAGAYAQKNRPVTYYMKDGSAIAEYSYLNWGTNSRFKITRVDYTASMTPNKDGSEITLQLIKVVSHISSKGKSFEKVYATPPKIDVIYRRA